MTTNTDYQQERDSEKTIRERELEVFDTFTARALSIVRNEEKNQTIADACRLVDAALKAARGEALTPEMATAADNGIKGLIEELHTGYEQLRAAQAAEDPGSEKAAL
jgi:hypothetical protein